ncbi:MAG: YqgE/AlgH family protein [Gammaproteobacteria bacterium]|nr:YqgE/AlgH family protein [Gammaproteobacteria bacterium]
MLETASLINQFLIAMPGLGDPNFFRTVTLVCEHGSEGAMGIVINRPTDLTFRDVFTQLGIEAASCARLDEPIYLGGPVQSNRGFVLHEPLGTWESTLVVGGTLGVSTSRDILAAIARNEGPDHCLLALGYAGWGPGQIEKEIAENAWLSGPASTDVLFRTPIDARWASAAHVLGVDLAHLSGESGHA